MSDRVEYFKLETVSYSLEELRHLLRLKKFYDTLIETDDDYEAVISFDSLGADGPR